MQAHDYAYFIKQVNNGEWEGSCRDAVRLYRRINEMFYNQGGHSPFAVTLSELRERLQFEEEKQLFDEINRLRLE